MSDSSVKYIIGFCAVVCLICSVFVCVARVSLKDRQEANKTLERQRQVLSVSGLIDADAKPTPEEVKTLFKEAILGQVIDLSTGALSADVEPDTFDQQKAKRDPQTSRLAPKNRAGVARIPKDGLVYLVRDTSDLTKVGRYILPVEGKGLWSTLYGYVALASDTNRIEGLTFYQHGETPGLGGEVDNPSWKAKWLGRLAFGAPDDPSRWKEPKIRVKKGLAGSPEEDPHQVDGLSGATITSNGVTHLLRFWLGDSGFGPFLSRQRAAGARIQTAYAGPAGRSF